MQLSPSAGRAHNAGDAKGYLWTCSPCRCLQDVPQLGQVANLLTSGFQRSSCLGRGQPFVRREAATLVTTRSDVQTESTGAFYQLRSFACRPQSGHSGESIVALQAGNVHRLCIKQLPSTKVDHDRFIRLAPT